MFFPRERSLVTRESKELLVGCTVVAVILLIKTAGIQGQMQIDSRSHSTHLDGRDSGEKANRQPQSFSSFRQHGFRDKGK